MQGSWAKFGKYTKIVERIDMLTMLSSKHPFNKDLKNQLKKAEDGLCRMIQKESKEIDRLLESLNEYEDTLWEE